MAKLRPRQLEQGKTGPSKMGFDGEEDGWVLVKKQRVIIVLPSLPLPQHFAVEKPAETSQLQAELKYSDAADSHETTLIPIVVPSFPVTERCTLQKPLTSQPQAALRDGIADTHEATPVHAVVPSLPLTEHFALQKPVASQSQAELTDVIQDTHETTLVHTTVPSLPLLEHCSLQKPAAFQSRTELIDVIAEMHEIQSVEPSLPVPEDLILQKPTTSQPQAELIADMHETSLPHTLVPSLLVTEDFALQKPAISESQDMPRANAYETTLVHTMVPSLPAPEDLALHKPANTQSQGELRDFVADTHETNLVHTVEPELCPDFTSVDKPELVMGRNLTTRKAPAPAPRRSLQDYQMGQDRRRTEIRRSRTGHKPFRFPRVMCSSIVMDNEKLRVVNLERKVERAGGLNEWVGSIGLGREFERMLRGQRMSKFQVANLTMEKLKQMGALAVGPRRKLIHAIRCVYHPHCLRASFN